MLWARRRGEPEAMTSLDLGRTQHRAELAAEGVRLPDSGLLPWALVEQVADHDSSCFRYADGELSKLQAYSERMGRPYTLYPTEGAPALMAAGVPLNRVKGEPPQQQAANMVKAAGGLRGRVLDTSTGLGYGAIALSRSAHTVISVEWVPAVLELARGNPWSEELFQRHNVHLMLGDVYAVLEGASPGSFDAILHNPPPVDLAGELYAADLYRLFLRALRPGGKLFHHVGNPEGPALRRAWQGVRLRLEEVGFAPVQARREAFGMVTRRPR